MSYRTLIAAKCQEQDRESKINQCLTLMVLGFYDATESTDDIISLCKNLNFGNLVVSPHFTDDRVTVAVWLGADRKVFQVTELNFPSAIRRISDILTMCIAPVGIHTDTIRADLGLKPPAIEDVNG